MLLQLADGRICREAWVQQVLLLHALLQVCSSGKGSDRCLMVCLRDVLSCVELSLTHSCGAERRSFSRCLVCCVTNRNIFGTCGVRPTLIGTWSRTWQCLQASSVISYSWYPSSCLSFVYVRKCSLRLLNHTGGALQDCRE